MRVWNSGLVRAIRRVRKGSVAWIAASALLAACAGGTGGGPLAGLFGGGATTGATTTASGKPDNMDYSPDFFLKSGYCPPVQVRPGTEALISYDRGHDGDAAFIRTQGTITNTARECSALAADSLSLKIGVAGRLVAGPLGKAEVVTLPIRVAVSKQSDGRVLFSQVFPTKVTLTAPELATDFSQVLDQVVFKVAPDDRDLIVFVGYDEGKPDAKGKPAVTAKPKAKPVT